MYADNIRVLRPRRLQDVAADAAEMEKLAPVNLVNAILNGAVDRVIILVAEYPDLLDYVYPETGMTPLMLAAKHLQIRTIRFLLRQGADENRLDYNGWSAKSHFLYAFSGKLPKFFHQP